MKNSHVPIAFGCATLLVGTFVRASLTAGRPPQQAAQTCGVRQLRERCEALLCD